MVTLQNLLLSIFSFLYFLKLLVVVFCIGFRIGDYENHNIAHRNKGPDIRSQGF